MGRLLYAVAASAALCTPAVAEAAEPRATVQGEMDAGLKATIQRVIGETDRPIDNRFEARRRARAAAEDAIAVLRSEGYYAYDVQPEVSEAEPPRPLVQVTPGPRFHLGQASIAWEGAAPDPGVADEAKAALQLTPGAPGRAAEVVAAEGRAVAAVQKRGYGDAVAQPRDVAVDHADRSLTPSYHIAAGALVRLNGLEFQSDGRTDPVWLRSLAPWESGDVYDPDDVAELEQRLRETSVYDSITVALAPPDKTKADGLRPVVVGLSDRKPRTIEAGASYTTEEGVGVNARWSHYNRLRRADTLALSALVSDRDTHAAVDLSLPHWRRAQQTLKTNATAYDRQTDAYDETGVGVRADVTRRFGKTSYLTSYITSYITLGASVDYSQTVERTEAAAGTLTTLGRDLVTLGTLADVLRDRSNDPLDPSRGYRLGVRLEPTLILGDTNLPYLRASVQGTYYLPLDKAARTVVAGRLRVGRIFNGTVDQIPASQRFYAGGGGSVRGFPYQAVGPHLDDDTPQGGIFLTEASLEVRHDLSAKWGVVGFVDAGAVGPGAKSALDDLGVGVGLGVRYNLGFAPIRVDLATPVVRKRGEPPIQIYVSIGQTF